MTLRPGAGWGVPCAAVPDVEVAGGDADLAARVWGRRGALVRFLPDPSSQLARALGLSTEPAAHDDRPAGVAVPIDAIRVDDVAWAVNMVVLGTAPARLAWWSRARPVRVEVDGRPMYSGPATTVLVASGQFLDGRDVVPRGHPGDGRLEIQVYALRRGERTAMRRRLTHGTHVPHPHIVTRSGRAVSVTVTRGRFACGIDGRRTAPVRACSLRVEPAALRLAL